MTKVEKPDCFEPEKSAAYPLCVGNSSEDCEGCQLWVNYSDSPYEGG